MYCIISPIQGHSYPLFQRIIIISDTAVEVVREGEAEVKIVIAVVAVVGKDIRSPVGHGQDLHIKRTKTRRKSRFLM